ncbi:hypothetical protein C2R22_00835 [Salinigranum rubrum]|uniref:DUF8147 domain-containing protein n=2 Tax=Salinigranum rubrum TaxID=755307 RepID=A0A2I8VEM2_9EURY|nr:hypothetical protein C2R22_00835 [Salinigranum rubrum]
MREGRDEIDERRAVTERGDRGRTASGRGRRRFPSSENDPQTHGWSGRRTFMRVRSVLVSLLAGVVVFILGTVLVTEALGPYVWPSLMVGLVAGAVVGALAAALVWHRGRDGTARSGEANG